MGEGRFESTVEKSNIGRGNKGNVKVFTRVHD